MGSGYLLENRFYFPIVTTNGIEQHTRSIHHLKSRKKPMEYEEKEQKFTELTKATTITVYT